MKGEISARTTYQKSAKGPVAIYETAADGKYVGLENTGRKVRKITCLASPLSMYAKQPMALHLSSIRPILSNLNKIVALNFQLT